MSPALQRPPSALAAVLLLAVGLPGCAVVSVAGTAVGVAASVGSAAVSVGSTVVSTTAKVAGKAVGASTAAAPGAPIPP